MIATASHSAALVKARNPTDLEAAYRNFVLDAGYDLRVTPQELFLSMVQSDIASIEHLNWLGLFLAARATVN